MKRIVITALATIAGYALMVVLITLVQEVWLGGVAWGESSRGELAIGGLGTMAAGLVGAWTAGRISRSALPSWIMAGLVCVETTVLILSGRLDGPLWFDLAAAASLVAAILVGGRLARRRSAAESPAPE